MAVGAERGEIGFSVVGVHGIWQGAATGKQLSEWWKRALADGLAAADAPDLRVPSFSVPSYTRALRCSSRRLGAELVPVETTGLGELDEAEDDFAVESFEGLAAMGGGPFAGGAPEESGPSLGVRDVSVRLARAMAAFDTRFGRNASSVALRALREVYAYLEHEDRAERVRGIVSEAIGRETRVLVAHSLGSVVAYDILRRGEAMSAWGGIDLLITCGSPLRWPSVRRRIGEEYGLLRIPRRTDWVNVFDPADMVTGGAGLADVAARVRDEPVENGASNPHAVVRYLDKRQTAEALLSVRGLWHLSGSDEGERCGLGPATYHRGHGP